MSPWQVAHLLSIIEMIKTDIPESIEAAGRKPDPDTAALQKAGASAMRTQLHLQASLEIPLISAICSVPHLPQRPLCTPCRNPKRCTKSVLLCVLILLWPLGQCANKTSQDV